MLNHFRTLLLNEAGQDWAVPGEELVPAGFTPVPLPPPLAALRALLLGTRPDRFFLNYRLRQCLRLVHATPLDADVLALDARVTYLHADAALADPALYAPVVTGPAGLAVAGAAQAPDADGRGAHAYAVTRTAGGLDVDGAAAAADAWAALPGSGYRVQQRGAAAGAAWRVRVYNRPQWGPGQLLANVDAAGPSLTAGLFDGGGRGDVYRALWERSRLVPLRLAALLLALAGRTDERRLGRG